MNNVIEFTDEFKNIRKYCRFLGKKILMDRDNGYREYEMCIVLMGIRYDIPIAVTKYERYIYI